MISRFSSKGALDRSFGVAQKQVAENEINKRIQMYS